VNESGKRYVKLITALALALGMILAGGVASARNSGTQNLTVSCDGTTVKSGYVITQSTTGGFSIKQISTNPTSPSATWARSSQGNNLPVKYVTNGATASWSSVLPSNYTTRVRRDGSYNCNGIGFGYGNYNWTYIVTATG